MLRARTDTVQTMEESASPHTLSRRSFLGTALLAPTALVSLRSSETGKGRTPNKSPSESTDLERLAKEGLRRRFGGEVPAQYSRRLGYELEVIERQRWSQGFLAAVDVVAKAREAGVLVGPALGAASASLVAYALRLTWVDPIRYPLLFERFAGSENGPDLRFGLSSVPNAVSLADLTGAWRRRCVRVSMLDSPDYGRLSTGGRSSEWGSVSLWICPILAAIAAETQRLPKTPLEFDLDGSGEQHSALDGVAWRSFAWAMQALRHPAVEFVNVIDPAGCSCRRDGFADFVPRVLAYQRLASRGRTSAYHDLDRDFLFAHRIGYQWPAPHPACRQAVAFTNGRILFDQQLMLLCQQLAGFNGWEADGLRRALASGNQSEVKKHEQRFISTMCRMHGPSKSVAAETWSWMTKPPLGWNGAHVACESAMVLWICRLVYDSGRTFARGLRARLLARGLWVEDPRWRLF